MNLPNRLTVSRLFLTVLFVAVLSTQFPFHLTLALIFFLAAAITDYVDGEIARRYALITDFGKLMDPLVDKIMTAAAFVCLVPLKAIPAWVAVIVISREFLITGLRLLAVSKGRVLAADTIGKHKTSWQIATVLFFLSLLAYGELLGRLGSAEPGALWQHLWSYGGWTVSSIAVGLTLYSGADYLWKHRSMLQAD
jgi:CDP-diacylglycerol--glycerol-3-phosphate 3-phosphatidyltransferase